jgi:peptidoglycan hydrolase CwlO-like protein
MMNPLRLFTLLSPSLLIFHPHTYTHTLFTRSLTPIAEGEIQRLTSSLECTERRAAEDTAAAERARVRVDDQRADAQKNLDECRKNLDESQKNLQESQKNLAVMQADLGECQAALEQTEKELMVRFFVAVSKSNPSEMLEFE